MHSSSHPLRQRGTPILGALLLSAAAALIAAGMLGSIRIAPADPPNALFDLLRGQPGTMASTLLELRLSRALMAFVTGAALALAGVMMQALLRNPLADPSVLGVSAGASVGALGALLFMCSLWVVDAAAFGGALLVSATLYLLARRELRGGAVEGGASVLLLTGVILSSACMALVTLMLSVAPESRLRGMIFWMIGDLAGVPLR